jgi:hypothetical protein
MDKLLYYKRMLIIAAFWNWAVTAIFFTMSVAMPSAFTFLGMATPGSLLWFHSTIGIVGMFGVGYFIASRDPAKHRGLMEMCVVEKFFFFTVFTVYFAIGEASPPALFIVIVDLVFGVLFLELVLSTRK